VWKVNASGYAIPPLPTGPNLKLYIHRHRDELPEEDRNDPTLMAKFELWLDLLANKRHAAIDAYEDPSVPPSSTGPIVMLGGKDGTTGRTLPTLVSHFLLLRLDLSLR
jgi:hypothetical protein